MLLNDMIDSQSLTFLLSLLAAYHSLAYCFNTQVNSQNSYTQSIQEFIFLAFIYRTVSQSFLFTCQNITAEILVHYCYA